MGWNGGGSQNSWLFSRDLLPVLQERETWGKPVPWLLWSPCWGACQAASGWWDRDAATEWIYKKPSPCESRVNRSTTHRLPNQAARTPPHRPTPACARQRKAPVAEQPLLSLCRVQSLSEGRLNVICSALRSHMFRVFRKMKRIISWLLKTWPHTELWTDCHLLITTSRLWAGQHSHFCLWKSCSVTLTMTSSGYFLFRS